MIKVSALHYGVLQQANHTDSEYLNEVTAPQRDFYLNRSKNIVIEWLAALDESNATVREHLRQLVKRNVELPAVLQGNKYIAKYPVDFYKQKSLNVTANRAGCPNEREFLVRRPTSEKVRAALKNANALRIWDFEQTFSQEASDGLYVYTEPEVSLKIYMDYIRTVEDVAYPSGAKGGSYIDQYGNNVTVDKDLDLSGTFFYNKIVNMATLEIKKDYTKLQDYQSQKDYILSIDRI